MIYEYPEEGEPIRQGDIFSGIPRVDFSLEAIPVVRDNEAERCSWAEIASEAEPLNAIVAIRPVAAIVISQDCDAAHAPDITLCEIRDFRDVERKCKETKSTRSWIKIITQQARQNQKWLYLPPDEKLGFTERMGADFLTTIRLAREELERVRHLRKARLVDVARQHLRERVSEFYRRYPVDEWYPLSAEELTEYRKDYPAADPFPWQSG